jgi:hypothetical protein
VTNYLELSIRTQGKVVETADKAGDGLQLVFEVSTELNDLVTNLF